jgi:hypothetical protein
MILIDVAEGDDVAVIAGLVAIAVPLAADADAGDVEFLVGRFALGPGETASHPKTEAGQGGIADEVAARSSWFHV